MFTIPVELCVLHSHFLIKNIASTFLATLVEFIQGVVVLTCSTRHFSMCGDIPVILPVELQLSYKNLRKADFEPSLKHVPHNSCFAMHSSHPLLYGCHM